MANFSKIIKRFSFLVIILLLTFQSCYQERVLTINSYIIDNQSSVELIYYIHDFDRLDSLIITIGEITEIDALGDVYTERIPADEGFDLIAKNSNKDVYLYRDSSDHKIEALKLNTSGILNWEEDRRSPNRFGNFNDFTLVVTDDMIQ